MKKTARIVVSALAAAFVLLTGVLLSPAAQAEPAPPAGYAKATQHEHSYYNKCPNKHYIHIAEWTYCLNSKIYGEGDSGYWYWDDDTKTLTFDNFVLKRANFTGSFGSGTFVEPVFDRSTIGVNELTIKFKGNNIIDQQSKGHSDALALALTMNSGTGGNQTAPMVKLIVESPEDSLTINTDITNSNPNNSRAIRAYGASLTIGGKGTINLNPGFSGTGQLMGLTGISTVPGYSTTITDNVTVNINSNLIQKESTSIKFGVIGIQGAAVLKGDSKVSIDVNGASSGLTLGMYRSPQDNKDISVAERARLSIKAKNETSPTAPTLGIYSLGNINFSTAEDAKVTSSTGPAIFAKQDANFSGPGDVIGSGDTASSLRADGGINFADGYGVYLPVAGSAVNPGVADKTGKKVDAWRLSMLPPKYEEVKTEPGKAVKSPVKTTTYTKDAANATKATYSAPETVEVNGKTWQVAIDATTGELTVTPHKDARKGDKAEIPVTLSYANDIFPADAKAKSKVGSNEAGIKKRIAIAPVVVEPIATPETPTAQDFDQVEEGNWQKLVMPSYDPDEEGNPNPLAGMFSYDRANVKYLNHAGQPFNPKDPVSRGKKAEVIVPLTEKGKENFSKMKCPADTLCELQDDRTVKFTVILDYKERSEKPDTPCKPCKPCSDPGTAPGGQQPGTHPGTTPGGTQTGTKITNGTKGNSTHTPDSLVRTGAVDTAILGFGASVLLLVGFALLRRRHS